MWEDYCSFMLLPFQLGNFCQKVDDSYMRSGKNGTLGNTVDTVCKWEWAPFISTTLSLIQRERQKL